MDQSESPTSFFVPLFLSFRVISIIWSHCFFEFALLVFCSLYFTVVWLIFFSRAQICCLEKAETEHIVLQNTAILWMREDKKKTQVDFLCCSMFLWIQMSDKCNLFGFFLLRVIKYMELTLLWRTTITIQQTVFRFQILV